MVKKGHAVVKTAILSLVWPYGGKQALIVHCFPSTGINYTGVGYSS